MLKRGDRVFVQYVQDHGDFNSTYATKGIVLEHYILIATTKIKLLDSKTSVTECNVYTSSLVLEEIWNSPLYNALKEENENTNRQD